jgi:hypothetical protein
VLAAFVLAYVEVPFRPELLRRSLLINQHQLSVVFAGISINMAAKCDNPWLVV